MKQRIGWTMGALLLSLMVGFSGAGEVETGAKASVTLLVTDFGINTWRSEQQMFADFSQAAPSVVPNLPSQGQILIPMPADARLPKTDAEKRLFTERIAQGILQQVADGGRDTYEIRLVQHIKTGGYFDAERQAQVKDFGLMAYEALALVKQKLTREGRQVAMPAIVGSNGAFLLTETLPRLRNNPIDSATLVDGRAYVQATKDTYRVLGGNLSLINTAGDALAGSDMIANHATAKALTQHLPSLQVFFVDTTPGVVPNNLPFTKHLAAMHPEQIIAVKKVDGRGYTPRTTMTSWELVSQEFAGHRPAGAASTPAGDGSRPTPQWSEKDLLRTGRVLANGTTLTQPLQMPPLPRSTRDVGMALSKINAPALQRQAAEEVGKGLVLSAVPAPAGAVLTAGQGAVALWQAWRVGTGRADPEALRGTIPHVVQAWDALKGAPNLPTQTFTIQSNSVYNDGARQIQTQSTQTVRQTTSSTAPGTIGHYGFDPKTDSYTRQTTTRTLQRETLSGSSFSPQFKQTATPLPRYTPPPSYTPPPLPRYTPPPSYIPPLRR